MDETKPSAGPETPEDQGPSVLRRIARVGRDLGLTVLSVLVAAHLLGQWRAPDVPDTAPAFSLQNLEGETVSLDQFRGQTVVLNFWATWCGPCRTEIPQFSSFATANPDVVVLGVATDGSAAELRHAVKRLGIDYPVLIDDGVTSSVYGVETLPTTVIVDADGQVSTAHTGILTRPQLALMTR